MLNRGKKVLIVAAAVYSASINITAAQVDPPVDQITENMEVTCEDILAKSAEGRILTFDEGNIFILCFRPWNTYRDDASEGIGPGFQAYQPPPNLYDLQDFQSIPGILGNSMVPS